MKKLLQSICWLYLLCFVTSASAQVQYKIEYLTASQRYQITMKPLATYSGSQATTGSAQVTVVVPTGNFTPTALQSQYGAWLLDNAIARHPSENPNFDYITFYQPALISNTSYTSGVEVPLFSFAATGACTGSLNLINNATDPFMPSASTGTNSLNLNVGNQISILGFANNLLANAYQSNYGTAAQCPGSQTTCALQYQLVKTGNTYQVNMIPNITYTGTGNITSTQQITIKAPAGLVYTNLTSLTSGATYQQGSRINGPPQAVTNDYIIFNLANLGTSALNYTSGVSVPLFKFDVPGTCAGDLALMPNSDPFTTNTSYNAKQQATVLGYGQPDIPICFSGTGVVPCPSATTNTCQVEYELESLGSGKFQVSMIPRVSYTSPNNITSTQQVTLKVPTGFQYTGLTSFISGASYVQGSRINTPSQAPGFDYILFNLSNLGTSALSYSNNVKVPLFTFYKSGNCLGDSLRLMRNNDPFAANTSYNSKQQLTVLGYGQPDIPICFKGTGAVKCDESCLVEYEIESLGNGRFQFSMIPKVSYTSPNNITSTQQMTVKVPTGFQYTNLTNLVSGASYVQGSRVNDIGGFDYIMFNLSNLGTSALSYNNGVKVPLFTFDKSGVCTGETLSLMQSNDPFAANTTYNSKQQLTVLGYGQPDIPICMKGTGAANCPIPAQPTCLIKYQLENVNGCEYQVSMTPDTTWTTTGNITKSAKITLRVPHNCFTVADLTSLNFGANFSAGQVIQSPADNPGYDYICFNMTTVPTVAISYIKGQKVPLFTFKNGGNCCGNIELMPTTDPMTNGNSLNANIDQHWATSGTGATGVTPCIVGQPLPCISNNLTNILGADRTICAGQSTQLNVTGAYTSYNWSPAATLSSATVANPTATPLSTTTYAVTATTAGGCPIKDEIVVNVVATPTISTVTSANSTNCASANGSITINATGTGIIEYSINNGTNWFTNSTFNNLAAGSYNVSVRIQGTTCTKAYAQNPIVISAVGAPTVVNATYSNPTNCGKNDGQINITVSGAGGPFQYSINNGNNYQTSPMFGNLAAGTYLIKVADASGVCAVLIQA